MNKQLVETWEDEFETAWADGLREGHIQLGADHATAWAAYYALKSSLQTVEPAENASDLEPVWREEFESIFPDPSPRFERTGHYVNSHRESMWAGFLIAKRNMPVVELPPIKPFSLRLQIMGRMDAAGIKYKVKS